jgi:hypothetical protein
VKVAPSYSDIFYGNFDNSSLCCTRSDKKCNTKGSEKAEFAREITSLRQIHLLIKAQKEQCFFAAASLSGSSSSSFEKLEFAETLAQRD